MYANPGHAGVAGVRITPERVPEQQEVYALVAVKAECYGCDRSAKGVTWRPSSGFMTHFEFEISATNITEEMINTAV